MPAVEMKNVELFCLTKSSSRFSRVGAQGVHAARLERHQSGLPELRLAHDDYSFGCVKVVPLESDRLADPHARGASRPMSVSTVAARIRVGIV